jgi:hypothetical protein
MAKETAKDLIKSTIELAFVKGYGVGFELGYNAGSCKQEPNDFTVKHAQAICAKDEDIKRLVKLWKKAI